MALWLRLVAPVLCHPLFLFLFFVVFPKQPMLPPTSEIFCQIRLEEIFLLLVVIQRRSAKRAGSKLPFSVPWTWLFANFAWLEVYLRLRYKKEITSSNKRQRRGRAEVSRIRGQSCSSGGLAS